MCCFFGDISPMRPGKNCCTAPNYVNRAKYFGHFYLNGILFWYGNKSHSVRAIIVDNSALLSAAFQCVGDSELMLLFIIQIILPQSHVDRVCSSALNYDEKKSFIFLQRQSAKELCMFLTIFFSLFQFRLLFQTL